MLEKLATMRSPALLVVVVTLLSTLAQSEAQLCPRCTVIQGLVAAALESYRHAPGIDPSLDFPKIETHIGEPGGATNLDISFTNFEVIGIPGYNLASNKFYLINGGDTPGTLNVTLMFPEFIVTGENYKIFGSIAGALPLHADGPFEIKFTNLNLTAHGLFYVGELRVEDVLAEVSAEAMTMEMVNILGDMSDAFNEMMSEIGLQILGEFSGPINKVAGNYLEKLLNNLLSGIVPNSEGNVELAQSFIEKEIGSVLETIVSHTKKNLRKD